MLPTTLFWGWKRGRKPGWATSHVLHLELTLRAVQWTSTIFLSSFHGKSVQSLRDKCSVFSSGFISPITKASSFVSYDTSHYLFKSKWPLSLLAHCAIVCLHERIQTPLFNSSAVTVIVECDWTALGEFTNCGKILRNILDSKMED